MDRGIDTLFHQPLIEFAGPERLATDLRQGTILHLVAARHNRDQFDCRFVPAVSCAQPCTRLVRLRHGER